MRKEKLKHTERKMMEEKVVAIWFGSVGIGEGSLDMAILGTYILFLQERKKQRNVR